MTRPSPLAPSASPPSGVPWEPALVEIAKHAEDLDRAPRFPFAALNALGSAGALAGDLSFADQLHLVRAVARADGSVGRILDGHLNAVERLRLLDLGDNQAVGRDLDAIASGKLWLGLWGADPVGDEGDPAIVGGSPGSWHLSGTKVFCSGAGGVHRAAVVARPPDGSSARWLVYVELSDRVEVDRSWFRGSGMRASESHRVHFDRADVLAILGGPGELGREPWFSRDAIRTAASWAGMADTAIAGGLRSLADRPRVGDLEGMAAGRMLTAQKTIDLWLAAAAGADADALVELSVHLRDAVSRGAMTALDEAARACGSRPFALGESLDRARRDLELLLLQHRLDPLVARRGLKALEVGR
jgi:alkylation response protein AidB-like acyl-CoA dehydrogenase